jgi:hypothetical protein
MAGQKQTDLATPQSSDISELILSLKEKSRQPDKYSPPCPTHGYFLRRQFDAPASGTRRSR